MISFSLMALITTQMLTSPKIMSPTWLLPRLQIPLSTAYSTSPLGYSRSISNLTNGAFLPQTCVAWIPPIIQTKKILGIIFDSSFIYMPQSFTCHNQQILLIWSSTYIQNPNASQHPQPYYPCQITISPRWLQHSNWSCCFLSCPPLIRFQLSRQ